MKSIKKICKMCGKEKSIIEFYFNHNSKTTYRGKCKSCVSILRHKRYERNKHIEISQAARRIQDRMLNEWVPWLIETYGEMPKCGICEKPLMYHRLGNKEDIVHFDHRNGGKEIIKCSPSDWFKNRACNDENKEIFKSCNFGILCDICNRRLPTKNRLEFLQHAIAYYEKGKNQEGAKYKCQDS